MKLRINGNSIRVRVNRAEFDAFMEYGSVADILELANEPLVYALEKCGSEQLNVERLGGSIRIGLPMSKVDAWKEEGCIGFTETYDANGKNIKITVEKELKCDTPEDCKADPDAFERPQA